MAGEILKAENVLKVGQRLEFYLENDDTRLTSRIEDMRANEIVAAMPMTKEGVPVLPRKGAQVYTLVVGEKCRYRFFTRYVGATRYEGRLPVWLIEKPATVERHQNREFVRVQVDLRVRVRPVDADGTIGDPIMTRTLDLSGNGVGIVLPNPVRAGSHMALEIFDIPEVGTLAAMGRVVRVAEVATDEKHRVYHAGILLENLPRRTTNQIVRYLFRVQRLTIAKGLT